MKTLRKNGGFTLVELIVVIAILAILAGVAVPAYIGYIKKANDAAALTQLDALKTAILAAGSADGNAETITSITVTTSDSKIVTSADTADAAVVDSEVFKSFFTDADKTNLINTLKKSETYKTTAKWTSSTGKWDKQ